MHQALPRPFGRNASARQAFVRKLLFIMFSVEFVKGALLVSVLPVYASRIMGLTAYVLGWAFAVQYVGDNLFRIPAGRAIDRWGYRLPMAAGLLAGLAGVAALVWLKGAVWLLVGCFLLGAGTSPLWPAVVSGATEASGQGARGSAMSKIYMASFIGTGSGPVIVNWLPGDDAMRIPFLLCFALSALAAAAGFLLPADVPPLDSRKTLRPQAEAARVQPAGGRSSKLLFAAMFLQTLALGLLTPVVTLYAREELGLSGAQFSLLLVTGGAAALALLPLVGKLVDKRGERPFLLTGIPLSAAATAAFVFVGGGFGIYAAVAAAALGYAMVIPAWNAFIARSVPKQGQGSAWGVFLAVAGSGFVVGPVVAGWMWESAGRASPFIASAVALLALLALYVLISIRKSDVVR